MEESDKGGEESRGDTLPAELALAEPALSAAAYDPELFATATADFGTGFPTLAIATLVGVLGDATTGGFSLGFLIGSAVLDGATNFEPVVGAALGETEAVCDDAGPEVGVPPGPLDRGTARLTSTYNGSHINNYMENKGNIESYLPLSRLSNALFLHKLNLHYPRTQIL